MRLTPESLVSRSVGLFELMIKLYFYIVVIWRKFNLCFWVFPNRYSLTRKHLDLLHIIINRMSTPIISHHRAMSLRIQRPWRRRDSSIIDGWPDSVKFWILWRYMLNLHIPESKNFLSNLMLFFCVSKALSFSCKLQTEMTFLTFALLFLTSRSHQTI